MKHVHTLTRRHLVVALAVESHPPALAKPKVGQVVIATGAVASRPWWAPGDATNIVDVREVLEGSVQPSGSVMVLDELGFHHATSVAELLAETIRRIAFGESVSSLYVD